MRHAGDGSVRAAVRARAGELKSVQEFGLAHLGRDEIAAGFIEFQPYIGHCRYRDCRHQHEPDCAIKSAVAQGKIHPRRLQHFAALMDQLAARPNY